MQLVITTFALCSVSAFAAHVEPTQIVASGTGTYSNSLSLISDHTVPSEGSGWMNSTNVYWTGTTQSFTLDFGQVYTFVDFLASLDNNDTYTFQGSLDNSSFTTFLIINDEVGNIVAGMDTFSSRATDASNIYVASLEIAPFNARYIKVFAETGSGVGDNMNAIGELQFFGSPYSPVPEPSTMGLLSLGLGLGVLRLKRK